MNIANRGMPSLCMQSVECRFFDNSGDTGVRSFYFKPTTADFLAAYTRLHTCTGVCALVHVRKVTVTLSVGLSVWTDSSHCTNACCKPGTSAAYALQDLTRTCEHENCADELASQWASVPQQLMTTTAC